LPARIQHFGKQHPAGGYAAISPEREACYYPKQSCFDIGRPSFYSLPWGRAGVGLLVTAEPKVSCRYMANLHPNSHTPHTGAAHATPLPSTSTRVALLIK